MLARGNPHPRSNGGAIALGPQQFDLDPVLPVAPIVAEKRRQIVQIQDHNIHVAVVVIVSECGAAAGKALTDAGAQIRRNILETPVAEVLVNNSRILEGLAEVVGVNFRVDVPIDLNDVRPAVIVVVNEAAAPGDVAVVDADTRGKGDIAVGSVAVVVVEVDRVVHEVGLEDIEPAVAVVVGHGQPHAGLLMSVVVVSAARHDGHIGERAVMIVAEQNARLRVNRNINVRPPVVVEVIGSGGDRIARTGLQNTRLLGNIGKRSVSVVVIKNVCVAGKAARAAHDGNTLPLAIAHVAGGGNLVRIQLDVVTHKKIQVAVPVKIEKGAAGTPAALLPIKPGLVSYIG